MGLENLLGVIFTFFYECLFGKRSVGNGDGDGDDSGGNVQVVLVVVVGCI